MKTEYSLSLDLVFSFRHNGMNMVVQNTSQFHQLAYFLFSKILINFKSIYQSGEAKQIPTYNSLIFMMI